MDGSSFARLLRHHRLGRGLTQEELAERARLSARAISDLERGVKRARASTVRLLAEALRLSADEATNLLVAAQPGSRESDRGTERLTVPHNLPRQLSSFIGRTSELAALRTQLERTPLLSLVGPGGVGKTRLALELAARFATSVRDRVYLVELASLTEAGLVAERVAAALGIVERSDGSLLTNLTEFLRQRQMLLVLDNCEHVVEACATLAEVVLQGCPRVRVLATSREPLRIRGEQVWQVPPLSVADNASEAVQLFIERAGAAVPGLALTECDRQVIVEICGHVDGIPLAIELAAARVKSLTLAQIGARLDDRFQLLVGGSRTAPPRQQTLHATLDWSYELLAVPDRHLFDQLAVFSGGWKLEAAERVCADQALPAQDIMNGLERLVDKSLVLVEQGRYRLLETVRQYAHGHLQLSEASDSLLKRHADYYLHLAEAAEPELKRADQAAWFELLAIDHENLRAVLSWSLEMRVPEVGLRVANALARFWEVRGYFSEARRWFAELLALPGSDWSISLRAAASAYAGFFANIQADVGAARPLLEEALILARAANAPATAAFALHGLARIAYVPGDTTEARTLMEESLALARQLEDGWATARVLSNLGSWTCERGDIELGRSLLEEGLAVARLAGERRIESTIQTNLAAVALQSTDLAAATSYLEAALATKRALGDRYGEAMALCNLGWVAFEAGDYMSACDHFLHVVSISRDLEAVEDIPSALAGLACVAVRHENPEDAMRLVGAADRVAESAGMPRSTCLTADVWYGSSKSRGTLLETARQSVGTAAETIWSQGWELDHVEVQATGRAVARAVAHARPPSAVCVGLGHTTALPRATPR